MKKYLYIVKTQIIKSMTYEFNVYGNIIMQTIIMITSAYFWRALYQGRGMVGGVGADSLLGSIEQLVVGLAERGVEHALLMGDGRVVNP